MKDLLLIATLTIGTVLFTLNFASQASKAQKGIQHHLESRGL